MRGGLSASARWPQLKKLLDNKDGAHRVARPKSVDQINGTEASKSGRRLSIVR